MGTIKDISKFDAGYFGIPPKQSHLMDPQIRMLIECAQEAIIDSGSLIYHAVYSYYIYKHKLLHIHVSVTRQLH